MSTNGPLSSAGHGSSQQDSTLAGTRTQPSSQRSSLRLAPATRARARPSDLKSTQLVRVQPWRGSAPLSAQPGVSLVPRNSAPSSLTLGREHLRLCTPPSTPRPPRPPLRKPPRNLGRHLSSACSPFHSTLFLPISPPLTPWSRRTASHPDSPLRHTSHRATPPSNSSHRVLICP